LLNEDKNTYIDYFTREVLTVNNSYLGEKSFTNYSIFIGFQVNKSKLQHYFSIRLNTKAGASALYKDYYLAPLKFEIWPSILTGLGFLLPSRFCTFGYRQKNIGFRYGVGKSINNRFTIKPYLQIDFIWKETQVIAIYGLGGRYNGTIYISNNDSNTDKETILDSIRYTNLSGGVSCKVKITDLFTTIIGYSHTLIPNIKAGKYFEKNKNVSFLEVSLNIYFEQ